MPEPARIEAIRERHAARLRTRADAITPPSLVSTLVDDDMAVLLEEVKEARHDASHWEAEYDDATARIDEIEKWATDHFGDATEFPTDLAFAFWGMPSAADLAPVAPDAEQRTRDLFLAAALEDEGGATT